MGKRQSNFELLRIICMFFIMGIHIVSQTALGSVGISDGISYYYLTILSSAGRLVCNTFVIVGAWFLVDTEIRPERAVNLWLEIFFYAVPITIVCLAFGWPNASLTTLIQAFFPVFGRPVWFGAEYICLLLLTPWLNQMLKETYIKSTRKVVIVFGILIIGCATLFPIEHTTPAFSELIWFCFLYLLTGMYKRKQLSVHRIFEQYSFWWFLCCYLLLCGLRIAAAYLDFGFLRQLYVYYREHYEALPGFVCSIFLFLTFKNWNVKKSSVINLISRSMFAVYIIHQTPAFYRFMWNGIFQVDKAVKQENIIGYSLIVMALIFFICILVDILRIAAAEKFVYPSSGYQKICDKIRAFYKDII